MFILFIKKLKLSKNIFIDKPLLFNVSDYLGMKCPLDYKPFRTKVQSQVHQNLILFYRDFVRNKHETQEKAVILPQLSSIKLKHNPMRQFVVNDRKTLNF